jgi:integrase
VPEKHSYSVERAREYVAALQERIDAGRAEFLQDECEEATETAPGTFAAWWEQKYLPRYERLGKDGRTLRTDGRRILEAIGSTPATEITREQIRAFRDSLAEETRAAEDPITPKRAMNVWSSLTAALSRAFSDDDPDYGAVRIGPQSADPCLGIKPPVTTERLKETKKSRQHLYPREFVRLMNCAGVPVVWRRLYAIAVYTYLRPEEIYGLTWGDVDLDAEQIHVWRTFKIRTGEVKDDTKTHEERHVPIHRNLLPLLQQMKREAGNDPREKVVPIATATRDAEKNAQMTRAHP